MAKQLNVNLAFTADTSKAKASLESLQKDLTNLMNLDYGKNGFGISKEIDKSMLKVADLKLALKDAMNPKTGALDLNKFNDNLTKSGMSIQKYAESLSKLGPAGQDAFIKLGKSVLQAEVPLKRSNERLQQFATTMKNTIRWQMSSSLLHGMMGTMSQAMHYVKDLDQSLNNIRIVTGQSSDQMAKFAKQANASAKALDTTTTKYTNASLIYYQQGLNDKEVKARTDTTIKMANVARESATVVSDQMTAIWNNFNKAGTKPTEYYADVITALGAATASSTSEISEGLNKFAGIADTVGLSYEYATSALATVTATTRQSADVVGTAFKTMFARIQGLKLGETLEDGTTLNKYSEALSKVGINIKDANGEVKDMDNILDEMADKWKTLSQDEQIALAQTVAGTRQYTQLVALMSNWDFMEENLQTVKESAGTLQEQADIYAESWEASSHRVKASLENVFDSVLDHKFFTKFNNGLSGFLDIVAAGVDGLGGMRGTLISLSLLATQLFKKDIANGIRDFSYNLKSLTPSGRQNMLKQSYDMRKTTIDEMSKIYLNDPKNSYKAALIQGQGKVQNAYLQRNEELALKGQRVSNLDQNRMQLLMDQQEALGQQVISAHEEALALKETNQQLRESITHKAIVNQNQREVAAGDKNSFIVDQQSIEDDVGKDAISIIRNIYGEDAFNRQTVSQMDDYSYRVQTDAVNLGQTQQIVSQIETAFKGINKNGPDVAKNMQNFVEMSSTIVGGLDTSFKKNNLHFNALNSFLNRINGKNVTPEIVETALQDLNTVLNASRAYVTGEVEALKATGEINDKPAQEFYDGARNQGKTEAREYLTRQEHDRKADENEKFAKGVSAQKIDAADKIVGVAQGMQAAAMLYSTSKGIIDLWNDDTVENADKVAGSFMSMASTLPMLAMGAKSLGTVVGGLGKASLIIAGIATAIGAVTFFMKGIEPYTAEGRKKSAIKESQLYNDELQVAKKNLKGISESYDQYKNSYKSLSKMTEGTKEYNKALEQTNSLAKDFIQKHGLTEEQYDIVNGAFRIKDSAVNGPQGIIQQTQDEVVQKEQEKNAIDYNKIYTEQQSAEAKLRNSYELSFEESETAITRDMPRELFKTFDTYFKNIQASEFGIDGFLKASNLEKGRILTGNQDLEQWDSETAFGKNIQLLIDFFSEQHADQLRIYSSSEKAMNKYGTAAEVVLRNDFALRNDENYSSSLGKRAITEQAAKNYENRTSDDKKHPLKEVTEESAAKDFEDFINQETPGEQDQYRFNGKTFWGKSKVERWNEETQEWQYDETMTAWGDQDKINFLNSKAGDQWYLEEAQRLGKIVNDGLGDMAEGEAKTLMEALLSGDYSKLTPEQSKKIAETGSVIGVIQQLLNGSLPEWFTTHFGSGADGQPSKTWDQEGVTSARVGKTSSGITDVTESYQILKGKEKGSTITQEEYDKLDEKNEQWKDFFGKTADGIFLTKTSDEVGEFINQLEDQAINDYHQIKEEQGLLSGVLEDSEGNEIDWSNFDLTSEENGKSLLTQLKGEVEKSPGLEKLLEDTHILDEVGNINDSIVDKLQTMLSEDSPSETSEAAAQALAAYMQEKANISLDEATKELASSVKDFDGLDKIAEDLTPEEFNNAFDALALKETSEMGMSSGDLSNYQDIAFETLQLKGVIDDTQKFSDITEEAQHNVTELGLAMMRMDKAAKELSKNKKSLNQLFSQMKSGNRKSEIDYLNQVDKFIKDMFRIDPSKISRLTKESNKLNKSLMDLANGGEEAFSEIQKSLIEGLLDEEFPNLGEEYRKQLMDLAAAPDEAGEYFSDSMEENFFSVLQHAAQTMNNVDFSNFYDSIKNVLGADIQGDCARAAAGFDMLADSTTNMAETGDNVTTRDVTGVVENPSADFAITKTETAGVNGNTTLQSYVANTDIETLATNNKVMSLGSPKGGGGGGGGGGGAPKKKKVKVTRKSDKMKRYHEIDDKLDTNKRQYKELNDLTDRLYGNNRIKNMEKINKTLAEEIELNRIKYAESREYLEFDKEQLDKDAKKMGVTIEYAENGDILNWTKIQNELLDKQIAYEESLNANGGAGEEESEHLQEMIENFDNLTKSVEKYDETKELGQDLLEQIEEKRQEIEDVNAEKLELKLDLKLDLNEDEIKLIEYEMKKIEDNFYKMAEGAALINSKVFKDSEGNFGPILQNMEDIKAHSEDLINSFINVDEKERISEAAFAEGMKDLKDKMLDNLSTLLDLDKEMTEYYSDTLSAAGEELGKYTGRMEHQTSVLQHFNSIMELTGKQTDYDALGKNLQAQGQTLKNEMDIATEAYQMYTEQADNWKKAMNEASPGTMEYEVAKKNWEAAIEAQQEAHETMLDKTESYLEQMSAILENTFNKLNKEFKDGLIDLTPFGSFDEMNNQIDRANSLQEDYLTTTNKIYETNKLMNTAQKAIDESTNKIAKNKLKNFIDETKMLQEQGRMSKFELDIQKAKYDLLVAEIALKEAQEAKSQVKLSRDSEGNFSYIYTADQDKVDDAQQKYEDAENNLYNIALNGSNDFASKYKEIMNEIGETQADLNEQLRNGDITEEEYDKLSNQAEEYYNKKMKDLTDLYSIGFDADGRIVDGISAENQALMEKAQNIFQEGTPEYEAWKKLFDKNQEGAQDAMDHWKEAIGKDNVKIDIDEETKKIIEANKNLKDSTSDLIQNSLKPELDGVKDIVSEYTKLRDAIQEVIKKYEEFIKVNNQVINDNIKIHDDLEKAESEVKENNESGKDIIQAETYSIKDTSEAGYNGSNKKEEPITGVVRYKEYSYKDGKIVNEIKEIKVSGEDYSEYAIEMGKAQNQALSASTLSQKESKYKFLHSDEIKSGNYYDENGKNLGKNPEEIFKNQGIQINETQKQLDLEQSKLQGMIDARTKLLNDPILGEDSKNIMLKNFDNAIRDQHNIVSTKQTELGKLQHYKDNIKTSEEYFDSLAKKEALAEYEGLKAHDPLAFNRLVADFVKDQDEIKKAEEERKRIEAFYAAHSDSFVSNAAGNWQEYNKPGISAEQKKQMEIANSQSKYQSGKWLFDTGGYTGSWGPEGKWAVLHEKEIVLNKEDTSNLFNTLSLMDDILKTIDLNAIQASNGFGNLAPIGLKNTENQTIEQNVTIHADFPNATNHNEIEEAFETLINQASQFANRKN